MNSKYETIYKNYQESGLKTKEYCLLNNLNVGVKKIIDKYNELNKMKTKKILLPIKLIYLNK